VASLVEAEPLCAAIGGVDSGSPHPVRS
jgi:hypothetical protein